MPITITPTPIEPVQETELFKTVVTQSITNPAPSTTLPDGSRKETNPPRASFLGDAAVAGEQMLNSVAKGIQEYNVQGVTIGTSINFANKNQHHICEPVGVARPKRRTITNAEGIEVPNLALGSPALDLKIWMHSSEVQQFLTKIRKAIEDAFSVAEGPLLNTIKEAAKYIAQEIKEINRLIKVYVVGALLLVQVEQWISLIIKFITSLPAILAQAFAECLTALRNAIASALAFAILPGDETVRLLQEINNLKQNLTLAEQATTQVIAGAEQILQDIADMPTGVSAAVDILTQSLSDIKNTPPKPTINVSFF